MIDIEYIKNVINGRLPKIENGDVVPEEITNLLWGAASYATFQTLFASAEKPKSGSKKRISPTFNFELRCDKCGKIFKREVVGITKVMELFMGKYKQKYAFDKNEMPVIKDGYSRHRTLLNEGHIEYEDGEVCSVFYRTGRPYCQECDEEYRLCIKKKAEKERVRLQQEYQQKKLKQEEKDALEQKYAEATISRYFKEFNPDIDEISDAAVTTLKESINALSENGLKLFKEACLKQREINSYYLNLTEYEYQKVSPIKCILTGIDLDKEKRQPIYYKDVEGEEIFNPASAIVFIDKGLLEEYSEEILREKIDSILESRKKSLYTENHTTSAFDINKEITFGRYKGHTFLNLIRFAPDYVRWLYENIKGFYLYGGAKNFLNYNDVLRNFPY